MIEKWEDFYNEHDIIIDFIILLVLASLFIGTFLVGLVTVTSYNSCQAYGEMGIPVQYDFWTGCMANHSQFGWLPVSEYFKVLNLNIPTP